MTMTPTQDALVTLLALNTGDGWPDGNCCVFLPGGLLVERVCTRHPDEWSVDIWTDATKILGGWYEGCHLGRDGDRVTLKDICNALACMDNLDILAEMQHLGHLPGVVSDVVGGKVPQQGGIEGLDLIWRPCIEANNLISNDFPECVAVGIGKNGKREEWAIDFLHPASLASKTVSLNTNWEVQRAAKPFGQYRKVVSGKRAFTLGEVLTGLMYELTWHGPDNGAGELEERLIHRKAA